MTRVLVIEDNPDNTQRISFLLGKHDTIEKPVDPMGVMTEIQDILGGGPCAS